jgi:Tuberculosis necrotizing toxin
MLDDYRRFNGLGGVAFLDCYWHTGFGPGWFFPNENGFVVVNGHPIMFDLTLTVGEKVDLFGSGQGRCLAPAGTPYANRGIPPSNLNTFTQDFRFNYHKYRVTAPFTVSAGPIAPWFGQPGLGAQYFTGTTTAPDLPANPRIPDLVSKGYLVELT